MNNIPVWVLLSVVTTFKHFVADFLIQNDFMAIGKGKRTGWLLPMILHCSIHASLTLLICLAFRPELFWLASVDFAIHLTMDRIKASPSLLGRYKVLGASEFAQATAEQKQGNEYFWTSLGFDQMIHSLTNLLIVYLLLSL